VLTSAPVNICILLYSAVVANSADALIMQNDSHFSFRGLLY